MMLSRRKLLGSLAALAVTAPAIIRAPGLLMPIKPERSKFTSHELMWTATDIALGDTVYMTIFSETGIVTVQGRRDEQGRYVFPKAPPNGALCHLNWSRPEV